MKNIAVGAFLLLLIVGQAYSQTTQSLNTKEQKI